jgi:prepilin-type N-terminal cleavage/methylation domain-containing protein
MNRNLNISSIAPTRSHASRDEMGRGFTLVEVLLSLALLAGLMTAMSQFIFSLGAVWTQNQAQFVFTRHTRAVSRHVGEMLHAAATAAQASATDQGEPEVHEVDLARGKESLIVFDLPAGDRLLAWSGVTIAEAECALGWRKEEGLLLWWRSRLEANRGQAPWRKVVVSPLVIAMVYECFDEEANRWASYEALRKEGTGEWPVPRRLRLRFARDGREVEETIVLPVITQGLPVL